MFPLELKEERGLIKYWVVIKIPVRNSIIYILYMDTKHRHWVGAGMIIPVSSEKLNGAPVRGRPRGGHVRQLSAQVDFPSTV